MEEAKVEELKDVVEELPVEEVIEEVEIEEGGDLEELPIEPQTQMEEENYEVGDKDIQEE